MQKTDINVQKIDGSLFIIYEIVLAGFLFQNKLKKVGFFEKTFLLAVTNIEI